MVKGRRQQVKQNKERSVIKKIKTVFFFTIKNWAVREIFQEIIDFYQELRDQEIKNI